MKLNPLQTCFGASFLVHLALIGAVVALGERGPLPPALSQPEPGITIVLMASPEKILEPPKPATTPAPSPEVEPLRMVAPVVPLAKTENPVVTETAKPAPIKLAVKALPPEHIFGDGGSSEPGPDLTTVTGQPVITARPDYLKNPEPPYPPTARRRHQEGLVLLIVKVDPQGRAVRVEIKSSSGFPLLDTAAQEAVRDWEFQPARVGMIAVASEIEVPVRFQLTP